MEKDEIDGIKKWWRMVDPNIHEAADVALQGMHDVPDLIAALEASQREAAELRKALQVAIERAKAVVDAGSYWDLEDAVVDLEETLKQPTVALTQTEKEQHGKP